MNSVAPRAPLGRVCLAGFNTFYKKWEGGYLSFKGVTIVTVRMNIWIGVNTIPSFFRRVDLPEKLGCRF